MLKNGRGHETLKSCVSHKWFDELSRLVEWFLHVDSDWIVLGFTTNLLCIFEICWMATAIVLFQNVLFLAPVVKALVPPYAFNKSLIKCGKIDSCLMQYSKKFENDQKSRCSSCIVTQTTIRKFCHLSYMGITLHNLMILLCLLLLSHPKIFTNMQHGIPKGLVFPFNFLDIGRNYVLIIMSLTIISNTTVLVSYNVIWFGYVFTLLAMVSIRGSSNCLPLPLLLIMFSPGLFVVLQKIRYQAFLLWSNCCNK